MKKKHAVQKEYNSMRWAVDYSIQSQCAAKEIGLEHIIHSLFKKNQFPTLLIYFQLWRVPMQVQDSTMPHMTALSSGSPED